MSNIIDSIRLSGVTYTLSGQSSGTSVVELTQAQYDALVDKDPNVFYIITDAEAGDLSQYWTSAQTNSAITQAVSGKQDTLVSGTNIKTINNTSILGSGNIDVGTNLPISAGTGTNSLIFNNTSNTASGGYSHAEGGSTKANGYYSHAEGTNTQANGYNSHAEGYSTIASGDSSHAEGNHTITNNPYEHASGQYNVSNSASATFGDSGNTLFSVGNGANNNARHNAFEIRQNGDIYLTSGSTDIKLQDHLGGGGASYSAGTGIDITNNVISVSGVVETSSITTAITSSSTDAQVPSAKAVNDKLGGLSLVKLTQAEYDALATKDNSTLYVIVN